MHLVMAEIAMAFVVMAYVVMAYADMANVVMAYVVMATNLETCLTPRSRRSSKHVLTPTPMLRYMLRAIHGCGLGPYGRRQRAAGPHGRTRHPLPSKSAPHAAPSRRLL